MGTVFNRKLNGGAIGWSVPCDCGISWSYLLISKASLVHTCPTSCRWKTQSMDVDEDFRSEFLPMLLWIHQQIFVGGSST